MGIKYELKHRDRTMLRITSKLHDSIKHLAEQLDVSMVETTLRVIVVGLRILAQNIPEGRPDVRKIKNKRDKIKDYGFIKVSRHLYHAVRMYSLSLNITITEAACRIVETGLKRYEEKDTNKDELEDLDPLGSETRGGYFRETYVDEDEGI